MLYKSIVFCLVVACGHNPQVEKGETIESRFKNVQGELPDRQDKPDHSIWQELLSSYASDDGKVQYKGMVKDLGKLKKYTHSLASHPAQANWERGEQMAYWINTYNAFTIQLILENWPVKSIRDLHQGKPWDVKWIRLGDMNYSLNQIENEILRPKFGDPRIHFALNCAARSCPPLSNRAFTKDNLETMLNSLTKKFLNDPAYNQIGIKKLVLSRVFEWYREDFGDLIDFINKYTDMTVSPKADIRFNEYDWSLNQ